jgi:cysteine-rich secretory family protein
VLRRGIVAGMRNLSAFFFFILFALFAATASGQKTHIVSLKPAWLRDASQVPLAVEFRIENELPARLCGRRCKAEVRNGRLEIDVNGNGHRDQHIILTRKPRIVEIGQHDARRCILVYNKLGAWYASPAGLLQGKLGKWRVQLLDVDQDGDFGGAEDCIRWHDAAFIPHSAAGLISREQGLARYALKKRGQAFVLEVTPVLKPDGTSDLQWNVLHMLNQLRSACGLAPMSVDPVRSIACQKHAEYLFLNNHDYSRSWDGVGSHIEIEGNPGYSREGSWAAQKANNTGNGDPVQAVFVDFCTMLHRANYLGAADEGFGVGAVDRSRNSSATGYSVLWGTKAEVKRLRDVVVVPAPGTIDLPLTIHCERPTVERDPDFYRVPRGFPVSVTFGKLNMKDIRLSLFEARKKIPLAGELFTPERPIHSTRPSNARSAFFAALVPLGRKTEYWARFEATLDGKSVLLVWSFKTGVRAR